MNRLSESGGDYFADLLRHSREMTDAQSRLRENWFASLDQPDKERRLFELEMLLKGVVCFGNADAHPGPRRREPPDARQYGGELRVLQLAFNRIADLAASLAEGSDHENDSSTPDALTVLADVSLPLHPDPLSQDVPGQSLRLLQRTFASLADVAEVMACLDQVPYRGFVGLVRTAAREIGRNIFFNPLLQLEFRPEFDQFHHIEILHIIYGGAPEGAQLAAALSFLSFFRILGCLELAECYLEDRQAQTLACLVLAVVRNDRDALASFMRNKAGTWLAKAFEGDVLALNAKEIVGAATSLEQEYRMLSELGGMLRAVGDQMELETRRTFELTLAPLPQLLLAKDARNQMHRAVIDLRNDVMQAVVHIARVFKPDLRGSQVFDHDVEERVRQDRMRRDLWMFSQVIRAFLAKAEVTPETINRWTAQSSYLFVREFIGHFRQIGYHLLRSFAYPRTSEFMLHVEGLALAQVITETSVEEFVRECGLLQRFLNQTFESMNHLAPLLGVPFNRQNAVETLRLYLDRAHS